MINLLFYPEIGNTSRGNLFQSWISLFQVQPTKNEDFSFWYQIRNGDVGLSKTPQDKLPYFSHHKAQNLLVFKKSIVFLIVQHILCMHSGVFTDLEPVSVMTGAQKSVQMF